MSIPRKALYFFCVKEPWHYVGRDVFERTMELYDPRETHIKVDGYPVMEYRDHNGNIFYFMRQNALVSYEFDRFLPILKENFSDVEVAGEVNWHGGEKAPDRVLTVHSIGDVEKGYFSPAVPLFMRNLLYSMEKYRVESGLDDFTVTTEATHWTGSIKGGDPALITQYPVPLLDIEIGSVPETWEKPEAVDVLARSLVEVFDRNEELVNILCVGGTHFADCFADAAKDFDYPLGISHILPNQWLVSGGYETEEGLKKMKDCVAAIPGGIKAVFYHEGIRGPYRQTCRDLAEELGIPVYKHKKLRKPEDLEIL